MKSLEIVNNTIVKQQTIEVKGNDRLPSIFVDDIRIAGVKWNDSPDSNYISAKLNTHSRVISMENLEQIKQDLEVLEIFKALIFHNIKSIGFKSSIKSYEALFNMGIITREQLDKLKQWLEENENDR